MKLLSTQCKIGLFALHTPKFIVYHLISISFSKLGTLCFPVVLQNPRDANTQNSDKAYELLCIKNPIIRRRKSQITTIAQMK